MRPVFAAVGMTQVWALGVRNRSGGGQPRQLDAGSMGAGRRSAWTAEGGALGRADSSLAPRSIPPRSADWRLASGMRFMAHIPRLWHDRSVDFHVLGWYACGRDAASPKELRWPDVLPLLGVAGR